MLIIWEIARHFINAVAGETWAARLILSQQDKQKRALETLRSQGSMPYAACQVIRSVISKISELVAQRDNYCDARHLPRALTHPAGNWAVDAERNSIHLLYKKLISGDEAVLENMRLYAQPFSGFDLNQMQVIEGRFEEGPVRSSTPDADPWVNRYEQIANPMPPRFRFAMPSVFGERGATSPLAQRGLINHDAYAYQERINLLFEAGVLGFLESASQRVTIVEIGAGFGALAFGLLSMLQAQVRYVIVDLPESLIYSALYLGRVLPHIQQTFDLRFKGTGVTYVPNYMFDEWRDCNSAPIDLAINTLSLVEMSPVQMEYYAEAVAKCIGNEGFFFEQNHDGRWLGLQESKKFLRKRFPYREKLSPKTIPALVNGKADLWSNRRLDFLDRYGPPAEELPGLRARASALLSDNFWIHLKALQLLQEALPVKLFLMIKRIWNSLGGKISS